MTSDFSGFCVNCNYSSETDVTVQFKAEKASSRESANTKQKQKKLQLVKPNRKDDEYAEELNFNHF